MQVSLLASVDAASSILLAADTFELQPKQFLGIPIALAGAVLMSFGTQYQSRGLNKVERLSKKSASSGLSLDHILRLFGRPSWIFGSLMLVCAVAFQIGSLSLSPLLVVQPLGVVALVVTAVLNSKVSQVRLDQPVRAAITMCVVGVVIFVSVAAFTAQDSPVSGLELAIILVIFAAVLTALIAAYLAFRYRSYAIMYVVGAGILYGFVATFAKVILVRIMAENWDALTWMAIISLAVGALVGMVFVQNAHSSGPPDLVIAGLTVVDPIVAICIGIFVLGEARHAPGWAIIVFVIAGAIAIMGVFGIARYHPQVGKSSLEFENIDRQEKNSSSSGLESGSQEPGGHTTDE